jgi:hypothetical protein
MEKMALLCILMTSILAASSWTDLLGSDHIRELMMRGRNNGNLLARRMIAFDLDPYELSLSDPALVRHLQRRCTLCESRESCQQDLSNKGVPRRDRKEWREYCPNASTLGMPMASQSRVQKCAEVLVSLSWLMERLRDGSVKEAIHGYQTAIKFPD